MRRYLWIFIVLVAVPVHAQQNFASISFGASIPMGDYGTTGDLASNGYARPGGAIKFDAGYFPNSYLGIGGSFAFGSNYSMRDSLLTDLISHVEESTPSIGEIPEDSIAYGSGFWNYINLFIGPHFSVRASQRLYVDFRILGGLSILRPPDQELVINVDGAQIYSAASNNKLSYGFMAGAGIRYELKSNLALKMETGYTLARSKFDYTFGLLKGISEDIPGIESQFWVTAMEFSMGLAYSF
jgi:hypothetical protein